MSSTYQRSWIRLLLNISSDSLIFTAKNSMIKKTISQKGGLGLTNLRKRLDLIYPDNYRLDITETDGIFTTILEVSSGIQHEGLKNENKMLDS